MKINYKNTLVSVSAYPQNIKIFEIFELLHGSKVITDTFQITTQYLILLALCFVFSIPEFLVSLKFNMFGVALFVLLVHLDNVLTTRVFHILGTTSQHLLTQIISKLKNHWILDFTFWNKLSICKIHVHDLIRCH